MNAPLTILFVNLVPIKRVHFMWSVGPIYKLLINAMLTKECYTPWIIKAQKGRHHNIVYTYNVYGLILRPIVTCSNYSLFLFWQKTGVASLTGGTYTFGTPRFTYLVKVHVFNLICFEIMFWTWISKFVFLFFCYRKFVIAKFVFSDSNFSYITVKKFEKIIEKLGYLWFYICSIKRRQLR